MAGVPGRSTVVPVGTWNAAVELTDKILEAVDSWLPVIVTPDTTTLVSNAVSVGVPFTVIATFLIGVELTLTELFVSEIVLPVSVVTALLTY